MTTDRKFSKRQGRPSGPGRDKRSSPKRSAPAKGSKVSAPNPAEARSDDTDANRGERIAKVMARAGLCSRREAETWIENGRVKLNGSGLTTPAVTVTGRDKVLVDDVPLPTRERTRLWLYHKPRGLVTTNKDPEGRTTVFERLPDDLPRVLTVGRLDINTEGLLLLTNDGGLARVLELPSTGWLRRYRVRAFGKVTQADLDGLKDGIAIDGVLYGAIEATLDKEQGQNVWMTVGLREGKNREVKRVLEHIGLAVNRLIRVSYGPFQLMDLPDGAVREIRGRVLRDQLGETLAEEAGADFDAPLLHQPQQEPAKKFAGSGRGGSQAGGDRRPANKRTGDNRAGDRRTGDNRSSDNRSSGRWPDDKRFGDKRFGDKQAGDRRSGDRRSGDRQGAEKRDGDAARGKWMTAREGKSETDRRKAVKSERSGQGQKKRQNAGTRQEKISPRSRFRMTSEPKPRKDFGDERRPAPQRKIWSDDGLLDDKQQEKRQEQDKRPAGGRGGRGDRGGKPGGDRKPRGGGGGRS